MGLALKDHQYHCYGDYLTWPDDVRYELIDGDAYLMAPAPVLAHQALNIGSNKPTTTSWRNSMMKIKVLQEVRQSPTPTTHLMC